MPTEKSESEPILAHLGTQNGAEIEPRWALDRVPNAPRTMLNFERRHEASHEGHQDDYGRPGGVRHPRWDWTGKPFRRGL